MEKYATILLCVILGVTPQALYARDTKHYRPDYEYNSKTDAFYKLHIESRHGWSVKAVCEIEGAELMRPTGDNDIVQVHSMFKKFPDLGDFVWVGDNGGSHESAEEAPLIDLNPDSEENKFRSTTCDVVTRAGDVRTMPCYRTLPFICKVNARDAPYDPHCGVFALDYKYFASVGSCYKIPRIGYTWSEAYSECRNEGAHLVVLNSETEREVVQNLTNTEEKLNEVRTSWFFFAGFRANKPIGTTETGPRVFKTIFNQTLDEAGCNQWSPNEPNNSLGREYCGSIFKNDGKFNDLDCSHTYGFICEKEVSS